MAHDMKRWSRWFCRQ